jgi:Response regulators consisting of a CheY-like receiver domain and a winged-helix DNA-binding domain
MPDAPNSPVRLKALVVDDQEETARTLEMMLKSFGYETEVANDGIDGLRKAATFQPDLMLLDISMPKLDGYDTCGVIRAQPWASKVRLVAVTGWDPQEVKERSLAAGFDAYLLKPVDVSALQKIARAV